MATTERIRGRQVSIEVGEVPGVVGWTAVGIVTEGPGPETGLRFEARAADPGETERRLKLEIEAAFV